MFFPRWFNSTWRLMLLCQCGAVCCLPLAVIFLLASTAFAQYRFDHWTADNGLPQNSVREIVQT
jgi:hypothetical protein